MGCAGSTSSTIEEKAGHAEVLPSRISAEPVKSAPPAPLTVAEPYQPRLRSAPTPPPPLARLEPELEPEPLPKEVTQDEQSKVKATQIHREAPSLATGHKVLWEQNQPEDSEVFTTAVMELPLNRLPLDLHSFHFKDLQLATKNFKVPDLVLGKGKCSKVFKGWLKVPFRSSDQVPVAVKRLTSNGTHEKLEWENEIQILGRLRHQNLVRLIGDCSENGEAILVYEYASKGTLDVHLFSDMRYNLPPLSWSTRLKVALEAAQGLAYLHDQNIVHRDFKAANILLGDNFEAKVTGLGLAKDLGENTQSDTRIMGTMGYLDPSYSVTGQLTKKSDIFAFGVLLLELISGQRAKDPNDPESQHIIEWARTFLEPKKPDYTSLLDPNLCEEVTSQTATKAVRCLTICAKHCIKDELNERPTMAEIVERFKSNW